MSQKKATKERMINLCFRTDPVLIDLFYQECQLQNLTRSEGFREIFNEYMLSKYFKQQNDETTHN